MRLSLDTLRGLVTFRSPDASFDETADLLILERLLQSDRITTLQVKAIRAHAVRHGTHPLDAIIDTGSMTEQELLSCLAGIYKTPFVSSEQVKKLRVRSSTLKMIGDSLAERLRVMPVKYESKTQALTILGFEPHRQVDVAKQVQLASGARRVNYYIALPHAVRGAMGFHYWGGPGFGEPEPIALEASESPKPPVEFDMGSVEVPDVLEPEAQPSQKVVTESPSGLLVETQADALREMVTILVTLAERRGSALRGHSAQVSAYAEKLCHRMRLSAEQTHAVCLAAAIHDVGKPATHHLTAINVAQYEGHRQLAERAYLGPLHTFGETSLPAETVKALTHFYERYDGQGLPDNLQGSAIPLSSRILAIADSYADITSHEKNAFGRQLCPDEGLKGLERYAGNVFDPTLVATFKHLVLGDELKAQLLALRHSVLVIESDPEESLILELQLRHRGYRVFEAQSSDEALNIIESGAIDAIISGIDITPLDGLNLMKQLQGQGVRIPTIFLSHRNESGLAKQALDAGAADYILKPTSAEVIVAKMDQALSRIDSSQRGVSGSLSDMALSDIVQVLSGGSKTGCLTITNKSFLGTIQFVDGDLWSATQGSLRGPPAFFAMTQLSHGDFEFDPAVAPGVRNLMESPQALLLEAMRHIDEASS